MFQVGALRAQQGLLSNVPGTDYFSRLMYQEINHKVYNTIGKQKNVFIAAFSEPQPTPCSTLPPSARLRPTEWRRVRGESCPSG